MLVPEPVEGTLCHFDKLSDQKLNILQFFLKRFEQN